MDDLDDLFGDDAGETLNAGSDGAARPSKAGQGSSSQTRPQRADSELDDLFGDHEPEGAQNQRGGTGRSSAEAAANEPAASSGSSSSSSAYRDSGADLEDVDLFLKTLSGGAGAQTQVARSRDAAGSPLGDATEQDDFLSWLEQSDTEDQDHKTASKPGISDRDEARSPGADGAERGASHGAECDEDEDDGDEFYIDQSGALVVDQGHQRVASGDSPAGSLPQMDHAQGDAPSAGSPNAPEFHRRKSEDALDLALMAMPTPVPRDGSLPTALPPGLAQLQGQAQAVAADQESAFAGAIQKVSTRLETLFEIDQLEARAIRSATAVKDVPGVVLPSNQRFAVWQAMLLEKAGPPASILPDWATVPEVRLTEVFPSARKSILQDCLSAWALFSGADDLDENTSIIKCLVDLVTRVTLRQKCKTYNTLLANVSVTIAFVAVSALGHGDGAPVDHGAVLQRSAPLIEHVFQTWGGSTGDWSSTGLRSEPVTSCIGVGGAGWSAKTLRLVALRRQQIVSRLLSFHDPVLSYHLSSHCQLWSSLGQETAAKEQCQLTEAIEQESMHLLPEIDRVAAMSLVTDGLPTVTLFGLLAPLQTGGERSALSSEQILALWDGAILFGRNPQAWSIFLATAALMMIRDKLLDQSASDLLHNEVRGAITSLMAGGKEASGMKLCAVAEYLVAQTPDSMRKWAAEEELLIDQSARAEVARYDAEQVQLKAEDRKLASQSVPDAQVNTPGVELEQHLAAPTPSATGKQEAKTSSAGSGTEARPGWLSSALKRQAQSLKAALLTNAQTGVSTDWSSLNLRRQLVELRWTEGESLGLGFADGEHGLEVGHVAPNSVADATGLVQPGDLVLSLNGMLVLALSAPEAQALIDLQESPLYLVVGTLLPEGVSDRAVQCSSTCLVPGFKQRVAAFYATFNPGKERDVDAILSLYRHRESVLLRELAVKYLEHIEGDPFYLPLSRFCAAVDPRDVVRELCFNEQHSTSRGGQNLGRKSVFVVDCRPQRAVQSTGRFPTSFTLNPASLDLEEVRSEVASTLSALRGDMNVCILGTGTDLLFLELDAKRARRLREQDRRAVDTCALFFLQLGLPYVGVIEGGFLGCYMAMRELGISPDDCLVNMPGGTRALPRFDSFIRYRSSPPTTMAKFLASKALSRNTSSGTQGPKAVLEEAGGTLKPLSNLISTVWKKRPSNLSAMGGQDHAPEAESTAVRSDASESPSKDADKPSNRSSTESDDAHEHRPGTEQHAGQAAASKASQFFSSVFSRNATESHKAGDGHQSTAQQPGDKDGVTSASRQGDEGGASWGWSARLKSIKVPDGLSSKLKTSVSSAYSTAQQKLATVVTELGKESQESLRSSAPMASLDEDPAILRRVALLEKGAIISALDLGTKSQLFHVQKEKLEGDSTFLVRRMLVVTPERFLVMEPQTDTPGTAKVKSNRNLKQVVRLRFPNDDPTRISLFLVKGGSATEPVPTTFRFQSNARVFTQCMMRACAHYNSMCDAREKEKEAATELAAAAPGEVPDYPKDSEKSHVAQEEEP